MLFEFVISVRIVNQFFVNSFKSKFKFGMVHKFLTETCFLCLTEKRIHSLGRRNAIT